MYEAITKSVVAHIKAAGCDDVIRRPFFIERHEMALLEDAGWMEFFRQQIANTFKQWPPPVGPLCHISVPKGRYTFRSIAYMSIVDTLKFTALAFTLGETIEPKRLSDDIVFSNRFSTKEWTLDKSRYDKFREKSKLLTDSKTYKVKVITDIANFYDRLNLHKLKNILLEIKCDKEIVAKIDHILIHWSRQQSFGMPVGSDGTRLLAEAMLINVDKELAQRKITFIRYVDDFRIFCSDQQSAYEAMQILDAALRREGLFVNSGKTRLVDLDLESEEKAENKDQFEPIDPEEKVEQLTTVRTRYGTRIAKYYKFPGQEAIQKLQATDLDKKLTDIRHPKTSEDDLKNFVKAAIYSKNPDFKRLEQILSIYPHLIPYCVDAIIKEYEKNLEKFDDDFLKNCVLYFRAAFELYEHSDYFRIQATRLLCVIDDDCGEFLGVQLRDMNAAKEIVFAQIVGLLGEALPRACLLALLEKFGSYGVLAKTALAYAILKDNILTDEEANPQRKNLSRVEPDAFVKELLKL